jgi:cytochrome c biogenesis factor
MTITGDISLGNIAIVVTLIGIAVRISMRFATMQQLVSGHTSTLNSHSARLDRYETTLVEVGGNLQRMIGRIEATQDRLDRRTGHRPGEGS